NSIGLAGWNAGIRWVQERGVAALGACRAQWASRVRDRLPETAAPVPAEVRDEDLRAGIVSVVPKTGSVAEIAYALSEAFDISLRAGLQCAPRMHRALGVDGTLRLSCGAFSTLEDADAAVEALAAVCG
ncbi:MAG: aminotransferase class V-fold PLP-dependent enzyme, partial [Myxococcota bacterium]